METVLQKRMDEINVAQRKLIEAQQDLIEAYKAQWIEMDRLVEQGQWPEKAIFRANAYGLRVDNETYVFQLDALLPFLPNPYYWRFEAYYDDFLAAQLLVSVKLRDVIEELGNEPICQPAALLVKHYYNNNVKLFDMDNKAKQLIINTFRNRLIRDDNFKTLPFYGEEAIESKMNRTMLYLGPNAKRRYLEKEIATLYPRIDDVPEAIKKRERVCAS